MREGKLTSLFPRKETANSLWFPISYRTKNDQSTNITARTPNFLASQEKISQPWNFVWGHNILGISSLQCPRKSKNARKGAQIPLKQGWLHRKYLKSIQTDVLSLLNVWTHSRWPTWLTACFLLRKYRGLREDCCCEEMNDKTLSVFIAYCKLVQEKPINWQQHHGTISIPRKEGT